MADEVRDPQNEHHHYIADAAGSVVRGEVVLRARRGVIIDIRDVATGRLVTIECRDDSFNVRRHGE